MDKPPSSPACCPCRTITSVPCALLLRVALIESNDTWRHPQRSIMTDERDKDFVPAKAGKGVNPDRQRVDAGEDQRQQGSKIVQFAVEQARPPARRLPLQGQRQPYGN